MSEQSVPLEETLPNRAHQIQMDLHALVEDMLGNACNFHDPFRAWHTMSILFRKMATMGETFKRQFPMGTSKEIAEELKAIDAKEYRDAEEAFDEMTKQRKDQPSSD